MRSQFVEKHLETTKLTELQREAVSDLISTWTVSNSIESWLVSTETKEGLYSQQFKSIFTGELTEKWSNLYKVGKTFADKIKNEGNFLQEELDKCQLGLNFMQLIVDTLRDLNDKAIFFENIKEVDELLCAAAKGSKIWVKVFNKVLKNKKGSDKNGMDYLQNSGVLLLSISLNYRKLIAEEVEHAMRKIIDLFF